MLVEILHAVGYYHADVLTPSPKDVYQVGALLRLSPDAELSGLLVLARRLKSE